MTDKKTVMWKLLTVVAALAAGEAAEKAIGKLWKGATGSPAPDDAADRRQPLLQVLAYALAVGAVASVARALANRSAAVAWEAAMDEAPPGFSS